MTERGGAPVEREAKRQRLIWGVALAALVFSALRFADSQQGSLEALDPGPLASAHLIQGSTGEGQARAQLILEAGEADNPHAEGLAHFVEHLAWSNAFGLADLPFDRHSNAWASARATSYWLTMPEDALESGLRRLAGVFAPLALERAFMEEEREIVLREWELRGAGDSEALLDLELADRVYDGHPLARSVIGDDDAIRRYAIDDAIALHQASHRPDRAHLLVVSQASPRAVEAAIAGAFDAFDESPAPPPASLALDDLPEARDVRRARRPGLAGRRLLARKVVRAPEKLAFVEAEIAAERAADLLDSNLPGGLARPLRFDRFLAAEFGLDVDVVDDRHFELRFWARPDRGVTLDHLLEGFEASLAEIGARGVDQETFARLESRWARAIEEENVAAATHDWAIAALAARRRPATYAELQEARRAFDRDRLNAVLALLAGPGRFAAVLATPSGK